MELTLHIGPHKTGTTSVQTAFARSASALRRDGLLYPKTNWLFPAQHRLAFALKDLAIPGGDRPDLSRELDELLLAMDRFKGAQVFLSSEEFFACPPEALVRLKERLGLVPRIITFLRRPDNFLISCYNQKTKQPGNGFSAPIRRFVSDPEAIAPEIDYATCLGAWAEVFGDAAIALETYEDGPPLDRICRHLGLTDGPPAPKDRLNASVPGAVVEVMRHAKAIDMPAPRQRKLLANVQKLFAGYPPYVLGDAERQSIISHFEPGLDDLFKRFGQTNPYRVANFEPVPALRDHNANMQDMMRLVDSLL